MARHTAKSHKIRKVEILVIQTLNCICLTLTIIGAIVWGIIGLFSYNIVDGIFGAGTAFSRIIYTLVGVAGLYAISFYWLLNRD